MSPRQIRVRQWIVRAVMVGVVAISYLSATFMSYRANMLVVCMWVLIFLSSGVVIAVDPARWFHLTGHYPSRPLSPIAKTIYRCLGWFSILLSAMIAFNIVVNFTGYWNGLYSN
jgi:hypothetical protein